MGLLGVKFMKWLILAAVIIIVGIHIRMWHFIKYLRAKGCKDKKRKCGVYCFGKRGGITEEEKEELLAYLEQL